ncbi:MAG: Mrp/NBP35 family ATP-binding protein [Phycisphaerae bacterium]|nr:Mrp/NBP35 family ATP-binding protein [Phycisphaerae bacterium]
MPSPTKEQIIDALRGVNDPELHKDLVTLGMVRNVAVCDGHVRVEIELTTPACPMKGPIRNDVEAAIMALGGVDAVDVEFSAKVRKSHSETPSPLPGVKQVIAVGAGKGGVGKSTVAVLAAVGLARSGAKVGLLDADIYGPSIPKMMGVEEAKPAMSGDENRILPIEAHGVRTISMGFLIPPGQAVVWRGPMVHNTVKQLLEQVEWGELDYLIVDLPPGTGDVPLTLSQTIPVTGAVIVCTPQAVALADAVRAAMMYRRLNIEVLGIIENMSYFIAPDTGKEYDLFGKGGAVAAADELGVPCLGSIPINAAVRICGDQGTPADVFTNGQHGLGDAVMGTVERLAGQISVRSAQRPASSR